MSLKNSHESTTFLTSGASQTQLPVCRFAYIFSLLFGSIISTHCVGESCSLTAVVVDDLMKECIALSYHFKQTFNSDTETVKHDFMNGKILLS